MAYKILRALAEYRYLTTNHILDLGIAMDRGHLGKVLASLLSAARRKERPAERKPKEIGEFDYGRLVDKGRLPRMYYLTKLGANLLETLYADLVPVRFPARPHRAPNDYFHKVACVNFHITLKLWAQSADQDVVGLRQYYDWSANSSKSRPRPSTRLQLSHKLIDADTLFRLRDPTGYERCFLFEMANGYDTSRVLKKMEHIARGLDDGSLNQALSFPADEAVRVPFVFEHQRTAELVASRSNTFPFLRQYRRHFLLKTLSDIAADTFRQDWLPLDPQAPRCPLF